MRLISETNELNFKIWIRMVLNQTWELMWEKQHVGLVDTRTLFGINQKQLYIILIDSIRF